MKEKTKKQKNKIIIVIGSDHAGFKLKENLKKKLATKKEVTTRNKNHKTKTSNIKIIDATEKYNKDDDYPKQAKKTLDKFLKEKEKKERKIKKLKQNNDEQEEIFSILICGTGIGMSIAANKIKGIRAALCQTKENAQMARKHNNANTLCLGGRTTRIKKANQIVEEFLKTKYEGKTKEGRRHQRRIKQIDKMK